MSPYGVCRWHVTVRRRHMVILEFLVAKVLWEAGKILCTDFEQSEWSE